ncbi:MAG: DegT/DnrJ/EryC1/StrS family aminotransferase [Spirochaetota bacterium]
MKVPFYTSTREYEFYKDEFDRAIHDVLQRGDFILGKDVADFEAMAAEYLSVKYAVGVASGTDALVLGSDILGFGKGEVITPVFTFFASASCIVRVGGKPVFVDIEPDTFNINCDELEQKINSKTVGILPVHLFLQPANMSKIMEIANKYNIPVLEDAAEAWGMKTFINNTWRFAGTIAQIGIYSFFPTKTLGAYGDAGLMVTDDEELYRKIKTYRVHGASKKYFHEYVGYNSRLDTLQAAILKIKIKYINESIEKRFQIAKRYNERLSHIEDITIPEVKAYNKAVYYVYNILLDRRDELAKRFEEKNIGYSIYYPQPLHLQKCFAHLGYKAGDFPVAENVSKRIIALPMFPQLTNDEIDYVCDVIEDFIKNG